MVSARIRIIHFTPHFLKSLSKLPSAIQELAQKKDDWFRTNPFDSRLKTHQLKGQLNGLWSYSANYQYRIIFRFLKNDGVIYYDIGTHEIYQ